MFSRGSVSARIGKAELNGLIFGFEKASDDTRGVNVLFDQFIGPAQ